MSSNKNFGITFVVVFIILSLFVENDILKKCLYVLSLIFLLTSIFYDKLLTKPNKLWLKFGLFLGRFISPIIMFLLYFTVVFTTNIFLKIINKDILVLKKKNLKSMWVNKKDKFFNLEDQF